MRFRPRVLRELKVSYDRWELGAVALLGAVVFAWASVASGTVSPLAFAACEATFFGYYLVGSLLAAWPSLQRGVLFDLPLRLLAGYCVINTALLGLAWLSPLGMLGNFGLLLAIAALLFALATKLEASERSPTGLWVTGLALVATTLWCRDSLAPISSDGNVVVFKPWIDGFYHAVHIRTFAESHGAGTIEDFRLAEVPARLYHYGVYMMPALVKQASELHSYAVFAGVLAPVGVFFTGLAAYAFVGSWWGPWPGVAAAMALFLIPDGAQQGLQNPFMSYHWLTHISPSATHGLALLAVAWTFVSRGCEQGNRVQLFAGWLVAGVVALYKLHFVVASALLLLLVPALFFRRASVEQVSALWRRALFTVGAVCVYALALALGQKVPGVPLIRFDGSAVGEIMHLVTTFARPGALRDVVVEHTGRAVHWTSNLTFGIPYVLLSSLGVLLPLLVILLVRSRGRISTLLWVFPLLLIGNFLVMFFGLALDFERSTPDELSHRPIMIVYFFVAAWVGGAFGVLLERSRLPVRLVRPTLLGAALLLLVVPLSFGPGVQLMWAMPKISPVRLPASLVRVAEYLRTHGTSKDVFQDSQFDRNYAIAALSERRPFVSHTMTTIAHRGEMVATRSSAVDRLMGLQNEKLVTGTAHAFGIRWFILHKGNRVAWPETLAARPVLRDGPLMLYEF